MSAEQMVPWRQLITIDFFATANRSRLHTFMKHNRWNVTRENKVWSKTKTPDERRHVLRRECHRCLDRVEWFSFHERDGPQIIFTSTLRLALQHDTEGWWEERRGRAGADGMTVRHGEVTLHPQLCNMCVICLWGFLSLWVSVRRWICYRRSSVCNQNHTRAVA